MYNDFDNNGNNNGNYGNYNNNGNYNNSNNSSYGDTSNISNNSNLSNNSNNPVSDQSAAQDLSANRNNLSGVAKIKVVGVGGAGNNAVNRLIESGLQCAEYIVVNTDNQDLAHSKASHRIQIGVQLTKGLGAGSEPSVGKAAAEENKNEIQNSLKDTDLLFITAGMGGGTGTGAAPVVAKLARELRILTVAVVTLPFTFEAKHRMDNALAGVEELKKYVDSIVVIPNDKIEDVVPKGTSFADALRVADEVLRQGIRGIAEVITHPSLINLDFADIRKTLEGRGLAHMGIGVAKGEKRIYDAVRCAVCSPLLTTSIVGATSVIISIIGNDKLTFEEGKLASSIIQGIVDYSANIIFGLTIDNRMSDEVEIVLIATGFPDEAQYIRSNEAPEAAVHRMSALSDEIDRIMYNNDNANRTTGANPPSNNFRFPQTNNMGTPQTPANRPNPYGTQTPPTNDVYGGNGFGGNYAQPQNPYQSTYGATQQLQQPPYQSNVPPENGWYNQGYGSTPAQNPNMNMPGQGNVAPNYYGGSARPTPPEYGRPFEPDDPIPDPAQTTNAETPDRKHRPKFVDYFIRKNNDNNNNQ